MEELSREIGKHFIVGLSGTTLTPIEATLLSKLRPLGIIIFSHNIDQTNPSWPMTLSALIAAAREACAGSDRFIVSIDHEGGRVHRLCSPVTHFPAAKAWGELAPEIGKAMGEELRSLGFNLNFAPVLDIHCEPANQVIGNRAFGDNAENVVASAQLFLSAMQGAGVLGCGKHFPGHGATIKDSHLDLPVLDASRELLNKRELKPFRALIAQGIQMIMTAHVRYPQLDPNYPATLSQNIITDLLRSELGFQNIVITDALEMGALAGFSEEEISSGVIAAGVDILLIAKPTETPPAAVATRFAQALERNLTRKKKLSRLFEQSNKRLADLIRRLPTQAKNMTQQMQVSPLGCAAHIELCRLAQVKSAELELLKKT